MWIEVANSTGVVQGMVNLSRIDLVKLGGTHGESFRELTLKRGTVTVTYYIDGTDVNRLNHYLDTNR